MRFYIGKEFTGKSSRYGILFSFERTGVFLIIHLNHVRRWVGLGTKPNYLDNRKKYI